MIRKHCVRVKILSKRYCKAPLDTNEEIQVFLITLLGSYCHCLFSFSVSTVQSDLCGRLSVQFGSLSVRNARVGRSMLFKDSSKIENWHP